MLTFFPVFVYRTTPTDRSEASRAGSNVGLRSFSIFTILQFESLSLQRQSFLQPETNFEITVTEPCMNQAGPKVYVNVLPRAGPELPLAVLRRRQLMNDPSSCFLNNTPAHNWFYSLRVPTREIKLIFDFDLPVRPVLSYPTTDQPGSASKNFKLSGPWPGSCLNHDWLISSGP